MNNHSSPVTELEAVKQAIWQAHKDNYHARMIDIYPMMAVAAVEAMRAHAQCALTDDQQYALERMAGHDLQSVSWDNDRLLIQSAAQAAKDVLSAFTSTWQPIETAPKDGQDIILLSDNGIRVAHWSEGGLFTDWFIPLDGSVCSGGMYAKRATHWMPLPGPPSPVTSTEHPFLDHGQCSCGRFAADQCDECRSFTRPSGDGK